MVSESSKLVTRTSVLAAARKPLNLVGWVAPAVLATFGLAAVYAVDPRTPGNYPPCLFLFVTGCYCPGCGTLRAIHSLLHGNLRNAIGYNLLTVALLPILAGAYAYGLARTLGWQPIPAVRITPLVAWATLTVVLAFWAMRNVPVFPLSALAP